MGYPRTAGHDRKRRGRGRAVVRRGRAPAVEVPPETITGYFGRRSAGMFAAFRYSHLPSFTQ
jgi:hypothetical protein